jgi:hypothetical protein
MHDHLEHIGRLYIETQRLAAEYRKLLGIVEQIKSGEVNADNLTVDMVAGTWTLTLTGEEFSKAVQ